MYLAGAPNIVPIGIDNRQIEWNADDGAAKYLELRLGGLIKLDISIPIPICHLHQP